MERLSNRSCVSVTIPRRLIRPALDRRSRRRNTFSMTVKSPTRLSSWCTTAIPAARAWCGECQRTSLPCKSRVPPSGRSAPPITLIRVLFPAPFSPTKARVSPPMSSRDTPERAVVAPNLFEMSSASRTGRRSSTSLSSGNPATSLRAPDMPLPSWGSGSRRPDPQVTPLGNKTHSA